MVDAHRVTLGRLHDRAVEPLAKLGRVVLDERHLPDGHHAGRQRADALGELQEALLRPGVLALLHAVGREEQVVVGALASLEIVRDVLGHSLGHVDPVPGGALVVGVVLGGRLAGHAVRAEEPQLDVVELLVLDLFQLATWLQRRLFEQLAHGSLARIFILFEVSAWQRPTTVVVSDAQEEVAVLVERTDESDATHQLPYSEPARRCR